MAYNSKSRAPIIPNSPAAIKFSGNFNRENIPATANNNSKITAASTGIFFHWIQCISYVEWSTNNLQKSQNNYTETLVQLINSLPWKLKEKHGKISRLHEEQNQLGQITVTTQWYQWTWAEEEKKKKYPSSLPWTSAVPLLQDITGTHAIHPLLMLRRRRLRPRLEPDTTKPHKPFSTSHLNSFPLPRKPLGGTQRHNHISLRFSYNTCRSGPRPYEKKMKYASKEENNDINGPG